VQREDHKFSCGEKKGGKWLTSIFFMSAPPSWVVFGPIISVIEFSWSPIEFEL
jgi:hypothetical protein